MYLCMHICVCVHITIYKNPLFCLNFFISFHGWNLQATCHNILSITFFFLHGPVLKALKPIFLKSTLSVLSSEFDKEHCSEPSSLLFLVITSIFLLPFFSLTVHPTTTLKFSSHQSLFTSWKLVIFSFHMYNSRGKKRAIEWTLKVFLKGFLIKWIGLKR